MESKGIRVKGVLMDEKEIEITLRRMASEIERRHPTLEKLYLIGIKTRGVPIAKRLSKYLSENTGVQIPVGVFDISFYRDDLSLIWEKPVVKGSDIPESIDYKWLILVDDVLYTGRTIVAAIDQILELGRPERVELAVLVDRGHREFPICPDYVGKTVVTSKREIIKVKMRETDGKDEVLIMEREE